MKTILLVISLLVASTAQAAMSQADCPPETIWNSSTNTCYPDPAAEAAKRERLEQERLRKEEEYGKEQQRLDKEKEKAQKEELERRGGHVPPYLIDR